MDIIDIKPFNDINYNKYIDIDIKETEKINNQIKCVESIYGKICADKYNEKKYDPNLIKNIEIIDKPYSTQEPNIPKDNYDLLTESDKLYCKHRNILKDKYNNHNDYNYNSSLVITDPQRPSDYDYIKDLYILRGIEINNKTCTTKTENYNEGDWNLQFKDDIDLNNNKLFNIYTKRKTN